MNEKWSRLMTERVAPRLQQTSDDEELGRLCVFRARQVGWLPAPPANRDRQQRDTFRGYGPLMILSVLILLCAWVSA